MTLLLDLRKLSCVNGLFHMYWLCVRFHFSMLRCAYPYDQPSVVVYDVRIQLHARKLLYNLSAAQQDM